MRFIEVLVLGTGFWVLVAWVLGTGCWMHGAQCWVLVYGKTRYRVGIALVTTWSGGNSTESVSSCYIACKDGWSEVIY